MTRSTTPLTKLAALEPYNRRMISTLMRKYNVTLRNYRAINVAKKKQHLHLLRQLNYTAQGRNLRTFLCNKQGNDCLRGKLMTGHAYRRLIQLRTRTVPTNTQKLLGRSNPTDPQTRCCHCGNMTGAAETLEHIIQHCPTTHELRVLRHNLLMHEFTSMAEAKGYHVTTDPRLTLNGLVKILDLILTRPTVAAIIDIAVPWGNNRTFSARRQQKIEKYGGLRPQVRSMHAASEVIVDALIVGARGKWDPCNNKTLKKLGLKLSHGQISGLCTLMAMRTAKVVDHFFTTPC
ncbi:hypothetical protein M514_28095 [Trichuris suis]|uniref:Reverse transcriptase zinc-binding domain-containing protein n=1 Tax=Trichuris suis TaxID=68888 RepID=A0A085MR78_9BILA|nr:hypothetical protein M514_28095 [Trichuris suis]